MRRILTRRYEEKDRAAVLAIFDSNLPDYFGAGDREWLEETLDEPDGSAFVIDVDGVPGAFGGYEVWEHYDKALLFRGMVARAYHGTGVGKLLLLERLRHIATAAEPPTRYLTVDTSPQVSSFFQHCGFELTSVWPGGYRSGMDMHELRFDLSAATLSELVGKRDAALAKCAIRIWIAPELTD